MVIYSDKNIIVTAGFNAKVEYKENSMDYKESLMSICIFVEWMLIFSQWTLSVMNLVIAAYMTNLFNVHIVFYFTLLNQATNWINFCNPNLIQLVSTYCTRNFTEISSF